MVYEFEMTAMHGGEMPEGLSLPDQMLFLGLRSLYQTYHSGGIDRETARREKGKLGYQRDLWDRKLHIGEGLSQKSVEMFKAVEASASRYAKERTLENADKLYRAVYGVLPGAER